MKKDKTVLYSNFDTDAEDNGIDEYEVLLDEASTMTQIQDILVIADLGLWSGRHKGYKEAHSMREALNTGNEDFIEIYIEDGELKKRAAHHDGTNHLVYRLWKPDTRDNQRQKLRDAIFNEDTALMEGLMDEYTDKLGQVWIDFLGIK